MAWQQQTKGQNTFYRPWPTSLYLSNNEKASPGNGNGESPRDKPPAPASKVTMPPASTLISQPQLRHLDIPADRARSSGRAGESPRRSNYTNGKPAAGQNGVSTRPASGRPMSSRPVSGVRTDPPPYSKLPTRAENLSIPRAQVKPGKKPVKKKPAALPSVPLYGGGGRGGGGGFTSPADAQSLHVHFPTQSQIAVAKSHSTFSDKPFSEPGKQQWSGRKRRLCIAGVVVLVVVGLASIAVAVYFGISSQAQSMQPPAEPSAQSTTTSTTAPTSTTTTSGETVDYIVSLTFNVTYSADLDDTSSETYKTYTKDFCDAMEAFVESSLDTSYESCIVDSFVRGSVVVIGRLSIPASSLTPTDLQNAVVTGLREQSNFTDKYRPEADSVTVMRVTTGGTTVTTPPTTTTAPPTTTTTTVPTSTTSTVDTTTSTATTTTTSPTTTTTTTMETTPTTTTTTSPATLVASTTAPVTSQVHTTTDLETTSLQPLTTTETLTTERMTTEAMTTEATTTETMTTTEAMTPTETMTTTEAITTTEVMATTETMTTTGVMTTTEDMTTESMTTEHSTSTVVEDTTSERTNTSPHMTTGTEPTTATELSDTTSLGDTTTPVVTTA